MFRVSFQEKYRQLVQEIAGEHLVSSEVGDYGSVITVNGDEDLKQKYLDTGLDGRGIAILGMKGFAPDRPSITFYFPDIASADQFKSWMCNQGEQYFMVEDEETGEDYMHFEYHDPGGSDVIVSYIERED